MVRAARAVGGAALDPLRESVAALSGLGVEIVLVTTATQVELLGDLRSGVRVVELAPLHQVLPDCDAVVHHAGTGTMMTAASLGIPQLVISSRPEQSLNGDRLAATSAGLHLRYQELADEPDRRSVIAAHVDRLLGSPAARDAARRLREEIMRQPSPAEIVPDLAALATTMEVQGL